MSIKAVSCVLFSDFACKSNPDVVQKSSDSKNSSTTPINKLPFNAESLKAYYLSKYKPGFCGSASNYKIKSNGEEKPLIIEPGIKLKDFEPSGFFPGFEVIGADFSKGNLEKCYMKKSSIQNSNLEQIKAYKIHLHHSNLYGSNFTMAYMPESSFKYSDFSYATLKNADVRRSNFQGCNFSNTNLERTNFENSNLMGADLRYAKNYNYANFMMSVYDNETKFPYDFNPEKKGMLKFEKGADLRGIYLKSAEIKSKNPLAQPDFSNIDFRSYNQYYTNLRKAKLSDLNLSKCRFEKADARRIDLSESTLYGATFTDVDMTGADLQNIKTDSTTKFISSGSTKYPMKLNHANLINAELAETGLEKLPQGSLEGAIYSTSTIFPLGFDPKKHNMKLIGPGVDFSDYDFTRMSLRNACIGPNGVSSMANALFKRVDFCETDLSDLDMTKAKFEEAYLKETIMKNTICENANFQRARLIGSDLRGANLKGADFRYATMEKLIIDEKTDFTGAIYNNSTKFPNAFPQSKKDTMIHESQLKNKGTNVEN